METLFVVGVCSLPVIAGLAWVIDALRGPDVPESTVADRRPRPLE